ncbi:MAG TPA: CopG family transcriptional regulator [Dissulfurispiraceae bacterium]
MTVATNIRLPEDLLKALKYRAIEEKKSVNQLIREAVEGFLGVTPAAEPGGKDPFDAVVGMASSGTKDGSVKHDHYLYGKKK